MKMRGIRIVIALLVVLTSTQNVSAHVNVSKLGRLVGWTIVVDTYISGEFEGPDFDKVVKLDNGWVIEFPEYEYFYEYHPEIVIFSTQYKGVTLYRAVIDGGDDVYSITRTR